MLMIIQTAPSLFENLNGVRSFSYPNQAFVWIPATLFVLARQICKKDSKIGILFSKNKKFILAQRWC